MHRDLYDSIHSACCHIVVTVSGEKVSEGSGFAFLPSGEVLTAAHVVTGRLPILEKDYRDPNQKVLCKFPGRPEQEYNVALCGVNIEISGVKDPLQIDLAVLVPKVPVTGGVPHLLASTTPPALGERVFAAGYSDELTAPFGIDRFVTDGIAALNRACVSSHDGYLTDFGGPIIKQGFVGNVTRGIATYGPERNELHVELFYIDNAVHSGASGGPICNAKGDAVGLITERSVTSASQERAPGIVVPSGCTIGIGLQPLRAFAS